MSPPCTIAITVTDSCITAIMSWWNAELGKRVNRLGLPWQY